MTPSMPRRVEVPLDEKDGFDGSEGRRPQPNDPLLDSVLRLIRSLSQRSTLAYHSRDRDAQDWRKGC